MLGFGPDPWAAERGPLGKSQGLSQGLGYTYTVPMLQPRRAALQR